MIRSEGMSLYQLLIPRESSYDVMSELGQIDSVMIIDHHQHLLSKPFINQVQRCDEILSKAEYLLNQLNQIGQTIEHVYDFKLMLQEFDRVLSFKQIQKHTFINQIEEYITGKYQQVQQQIDTLSRLKSKLQNTIEAKEAMINARKWLGIAYFHSKSSTALDFDEQMIKSYHQHGGMMPSQKFTHFVGVMDAKDYQIFQRTVFRITKGNFMVNQTLLSVSRSCFLLIFPSFSLQSETWRKIKKLCDVLKVDHISLPITEEQWDQRYCDYDKEIIEIENMDKLTNQLLQSILKPLLEDGNAQPSLLFIRFYLVRERTLYENLNKVKMQQSIFLANLWVRTSEIQLLEDILQTIKMKNPHIPAPQIKKNAIANQKPPTFFQTNQFNKLFQLITETYGIPDYKEINPSIFSIITFPFLFGVMFGDIGHGAAILIFGIFLSMNKIFSPRSEQKMLREQRIQLGQQVKKQINSKDFNDEDLNTDFNLTQIIFDLRYMLLLCGAFSLYTGFIYNEYFGLSLNIFGSCLNKTDCTYPFGLDPQYEDLNFRNSYKMKLAIIIGFCQMLLGILCSGFNYIYFKKWINLSIIFPAKLLFFTLFIGYMVLLIIIKWSTFHLDTSQSPSIITTLVDMWMHDGQVTLKTFESADFQFQLQKIIIVICILCIPFLLFAPIIADIIAMLKRKKKDPKSLQEFEMVPQNMNSDSSNDEIISEQSQHSSYIDIIVEHLIETLEFVLGCISNTASYLRLWALSLAHSELAKVLFDLTLKDPIANANLLASLVGMPVFLLSTLGILLCMDSMECFLHALRLHWVEFQNKFYKGNGYNFEVFSYRKEMQKYQEKMKT
ncbi:unnamed protein product [Paramecium octaurelia]|uniref:V-type proton ATPase subunit a n=1 Tax=Paramecium octaurelia TaxID=43137 RepID=A0A8S1SQK2_PAROT|nr:unnamed protein product [Paramecium octaurelia]